MNPMKRPCFFSTELKKVVKKIPSLFQINGIIVYREKTTKFSLKLLWEKSNRKAFPSIKETGLVSIRN
jgi:hypothetical protein